MSHFDLARAIVALANKPFDPLPLGLRPMSEQQTLRRVVDTVEWYAWPIDGEKLREHTGITLRSCSELDRNIELKRELHERFRNAPGDEREKLVNYYVKTWGGINNIGPDTCRRYARERAESLADSGLGGIASRSKALVLHDPSRYATYDSRVAVSLNYLVIRRIGHGRGYIGQRDGRRCFSLPPPRANWTQAAHRACRTLSERFDIPFYATAAPDFYSDYLRGIREAASMLSDSEHREICLHWVESMLFGMAQGCAAGLHAACRLSEPLSFTVVAGPRKGALVDLLAKLGRWDGRWETPEAVLEERLKQHSRKMHREFENQHGVREEEGEEQSDGTRSGDSKGLPRSEEWDRPQ